MPYDPSLPLPNSPLESQVIRDQLQALFSLINNIVTVGAAQVDGVTTLPAGSPASVGVTVASGTLHLTLALPQGQPGADGAPGPQGLQGPPFANALVESVTTLNPGEAASVQTSFDGISVRFSFGLPRGQDGSPGANGNDGPTGSPGTNGTDGAQGPPGEISAAQLSNAIAGTSANTNAVPTLDLPFTDPETEALRQKLNELIQNGRR